MSELTRAQLVQKFVTGYKPTEQDFADLIDSMSSAPIADVIVTENTSAVNITDLDAALHGGYTVIALLKGNGSNVALTLYLNGDTEASHYVDGSYSVVQLTTHQTGSFSAPLGLCTCSSGKTAFIDLTLIKGPDCTGVIMHSLGYSSVTELSNSGVKYTPPTNITSLLFQASVANGIGAGSRFKVFRLGA